MLPLKIKKGVKPEGEGILSLQMGLMMKKSKKEEEGLWGQGGVNVTELNKSKNARRLPSR